MNKSSTNVNRLDRLYRSALAKIHGKPSYENLKSAQLIDQTKVFLIRHG